MTAAQPTAVRVPLYAALWFSLIAILSSRPATAIAPPVLFSLGNRVWFDADNSGTINGAEAGINGVHLKLYAAGNLATIIGSATTANGGYYLFNNLAAGDYVVAIDPADFQPGNVLAGYWSSGISRTSAGLIGETAAPAANSDIDSDDNGTTQFSGPLAGSVASSVTTLGPATNSEPSGETDLDGGNQGQADGQANMTVDFGFYTTRLGNLVWNDVDNNGLLDGGEPGIGAVTVELHSGDGSALLDMTNTDGSGIYEFDGLPAGDYVVRLPASNFNPTGVLRDWRSSTGLLPTIAYEPAPDPDSNQADSDDNGTETNGLLGLGGYIQTAPVTLTPGAGQSVDSNGQSTEFRVDFGVNRSPQIDLTATNSDSQSSYVPGQTLHYVVVVTNLGPADANGMTVHGTRPPQIDSWTWTCAAGTPASYNCSSDATNAATFTDSLDLPQLASVTYDVVAQVGAVVSGTLTNTVYVVPPAGMTDLTNGDNVATDVDAPGGVDLSVTNTDGQSSYAAAGTVSYTIVVTNHGPADANGMTVSDARPTQVTSWSWVCDAGTPAGYNCTGDATNPATFTDSLDLPAFASVTYHITAQIVGSVAGNLNNGVQVTPPGTLPELNPSDNTATDTDTLAATTLAITKTAAPSPAVLTSGILTYTIQVSNTGTASATNLTLTDTLPAAVTYISASGSGWSCSQSAGVVTCTTPLLAVGTTSTIQITVQAPATTVIVVNSATVSAGNASPATASTQTQVTTSIPALDGWALLALAFVLPGMALCLMTVRR